MTKGLEHFLAQRGVIDYKLNRVSNYIDNFNAETDSINHLKARREILVDARKDFDQLQNEIEQRDKTTEIEIHRNARADFEDKYCDLIASIDDLIDKKTNSNKSRPASNTNLSTSQNHSETNNSMLLSLPVVNLKTFGGDYKDWLNFENSFKSVINDNESLNNCQRFQYLKSSLRDEALRAIEYLTINEQNYFEAWNILEKRFKNTRLIVQDHVMAILNAPVINKQSYQALRDLLNLVINNITSLKNLELPTDKWDALLVPIIFEKLDYNSKREWQTSLNSAVPTYDQLISFLERRCSVLASINYVSNNKVANNTQNSSAPKQHQFSKFRTVTSHPVVHKKTFLCVFCKETNHNITHCKGFLELSISERLSSVDRLNLCANCLRDNHKIANCRSNMKCRTCSQHHHTLLHLNESSNTNSTVNAFVSKTNSHTTLLSTAVVLIKNSKDKYVQCRAFLDAGSMSHFITESLCKKLNLTPTRANVQIKCLNGTTSTANKEININLKSRINAFSAELNCLVVKTITENLPLVTLDSHNLEIPRNIHLADPRFYEEAQVDLLIGASLFLQLLCIGQIKSPNGITFQKTQLGFIAGGTFHEATAIKSTVCNLSTIAADDRLDKQVRAFWELENVNTQANLSNEEHECEQFFREYTNRDAGGRFIVRLPVKADKINLGDSQKTALKRFYNLERRLNKDHDLKTQYSNFMSEYLNSNHMELLVDKVDEDKCNFLPHHPVFKKEGTTTKLRVVFDASAKTSNGASLNDNLMMGAVLQQDIFSIIVRFRSFQFVLTADIVKMYRQILIHPDDANYQLILWRDDNNKPVDTYRLTTLTYGTKPASFIATRCLQELAEQNRLDYPVASEIIRRDFYMDDLLTGADSIQEISQIKNDVSTILRQGQFELRKFKSNDSRVLIDSTNTTLNSQSDVPLHKNELTKTLGLLWMPENDFLKYEVQLEDIPRKVTKRIILSITAQIFDPLGLVGPIIMKAKIILQRLSALKLDWDESVPSEIYTMWIAFITELKYLSNLHLPRTILAIFPPAFIELHGFCDASQLGYGAAVYIRTSNGNNLYETRLVCSKSRVAPLKTITLPRLELCGALLLANLVEKVKSCLNLTIVREFLWTDSTIVLAWINTPSNSLKTFVSNRVAEINLITVKLNWRHVRSENNPADILSRGALPNDLIKNVSWLSGPRFLKDKEEQWPPSAAVVTNIEIPERRVALITTTDPEMPLLTKFSNFNKLQRVLAWILRFTHNCRTINNKRSGNLSLNELQNSKHTIVRLIQEKEFFSEIKKLKTNMQIPNNSKLISLSPFMDKNGLLRVGGRLKNANIANDVKHPLVLPKSHFVTKLIIKADHERNLHAGPQATLAVLRQQFWILSARSVVRQVLHNCIKCFRVDPVNLNPKMGNLPENRVQPCRPFLTSGVDYAGPVLLREFLGRGKRLVKAYIALFVCFATKAVHIELVLNLTSDEFLAALRRFIGRRGHPQHIYSDNGTNFVGANNELKELDNFLKSKNPSIATNLSNIGIEWHFIPPKSPHMGGLWESNIKSTKRHIKRTIGDAHLTYSEMLTLLVRIEACLNSRPLTPLSSNPNDLEVLTPGHFLIGEPLTAFPEQDVQQVSIHRLKRWQVVERIRAHFWKRWSREYLVQLQARPKWRTDLNPHSSTPDALLGALVVLIDENTQPLQWKMARIEEVHPGKDNTVRVVTVRTPQGLFKRALHKVCILPIEEDSKV